QNVQPELISGWRGDLMAQKLNALLVEYPQ
ncbi:MAG: hypothetical protein K0R86_2431, partial [Enterobacter kobei]|nr:hypothetical protein [Enterobacter kobei]